jgi:broad specificity phosphatase PhoE
VKTVYLVRHGESLAQVSDSYLASDQGLTARGREQARTIAERVAKLPVTHILCSSMQRTRETADIIREHVDLPIEYSGVLVERRIPSSVHGLKKTDPDAVATIERWFKTTDGLADVHEGDGENFADLKLRADTALDLFEAHPAQDILVVGHGYFGRVLMARVVFGHGLTGDQFYPFSWGFRTKNTGLSIFRFDPEDKQGRLWHTVVWNDHAHLG